MTGETEYVSHSEGFLPSSPDLPFKLKKSGRLYIREVKCLLIVRRDLDILVKTFSGSSQDCLKSRPSQEYFKTFSGFFSGFIWTLSELSQDFLSTFQGLSHSQNFVINFQNFLRSFHEFLLAS